MSNVQMEWQQATRPHSGHHGLPVDHTQCVLPICVMCIVVRTRGGKGQVQMRERTGCAISIRNRSIVSTNPSALNVSISTSSSLYSRERNATSNEDEE